MPFEDELSEELRRTGETFDLTGSTTVVDGALERGRRTVRRRRTAAVAGSVLALALVGGGGAVAAGLLDRPGHAGNVASSGPAAPSATATPTAAPTTTPTATPTAVPTDAAEDGPRSGKPVPGPSSSTSLDRGNPAPSLDYTLLMPTFLRLLPERLPVVEKTDSGGEFASVVVDDGEGRSLVQINVQPGMRDTVGDLYGEATTLPDGTLLATSKTPGEKGGAGVLWWSADTMRPDGMRVVVSAFNSGAQSTPATRPEPALTMDQLTALATSPEWLKLQQ
ncbi:hypothetical protein [Streptomyces sp. NPDC006267]|uniref:hypothetical protein n=1 Tax=unclassified Streptomyces TaxID=2593676 RepID=UPI0033B24A9B